MYMFLKLLGREKAVLSKAITISVLNQAVSSATNFLYGLYLVRFLEPSQFGLYGIGFAVSLFFGAIGSALFLTQMVVHAPEKVPGDSTCYAARILLCILIFSLGLSILAAVSIVLFSCYSTWMVNFLPLCFSTIGASVAYLVKDFFIRHSYTIRKEKWALLINSSVLVGLCLCVAVKRIDVGYLDSSSSLWFYAVGNFVGVLTGLVLTRLPFRSIKLEDLRGDFLEAWVGGRWLSLTTIFYFLRTQAHTIIASSTLGPAALGHLNATRIFVTPAVMLTPALSQVFMPRLALLRINNPDKVIRNGMLFSFLLFFVAFCYSAILIAVIDYISPLVLGGKYDSILDLLIFWCLYTIVLSFRNGIELVSQVLRMFKSYAFVNLFSAILTLSFVILLVDLFGVFGVIPGMILGEVSLIIGCLIVHRIVCKSI